MAVVSILLGFCVEAGIVNGGFLHQNEKAPTTIPEMTTTPAPTMSQAASTTIPEMAATPSPATQAATWPAAEQEPWIAHETRVQRKATEEVAREANAKDAEESAEDMRTRRATGATGGAFTLNFQQCGSTDDNSLSVTPDSLTLGGQGRSVTISGTRPGGVTGGTFELRITTTRVTTVRGNINVPKNVQIEHQGNDLGSIYWEGGNNIFQPDNTFSASVRITLKEILKLEFLQLVRMQLKATATIDGTSREWLCLELGAVPVVTQQCKTKPSLCEFATEAQCRSPIFKSRWAVAGTPASETCQWLGNSCRTRTSMCELANEDQCRSNTYKAVWGVVGTEASSNCELKAPTECSYVHCGAGHAVNPVIGVCLGYCNPGANLDACDESLNGLKAVGYRGCQSVTRDGRTCQKWTAQSPQRHSMYPTILNVGLGDHNYCRNPDGSDTIWCYTTVPCPGNTHCETRWDYCDPL
jgi:hypothetical protein